MAEIEDHDAIGLTDSVGVAVLARSLSGAFLPRSVWGSGARAWAWAVSTAIVAILGELIQPASLALTGHYFTVVARVVLGRLLHGGASLGGVVCMRSVESPARKGVPVLGDGNQCAGPEGHDQALLGGVSAVEFQLDPSDGMNCSGGVG